jgi:hypothetical protein
MPGPSPGVLFCAALPCAASLYRPALGCFRSAYNTNEQPPMLQYPPIQDCVALLGVAEVDISCPAVTPGHTVLCFSLLVLVMDASCALCL